MCCPPVSVRPLVRYGRDRTVDYIDRLRYRHKGTKETKGVASRSIQSRPLCRHAPPDQEVEHLWARRAGRWCPAADQVRYGVPSGSKASVLTRPSSWRAPRDSLQHAGTARSRLRSHKSQNQSESGNATSDPTCRADLAAALVAAAAPPGRSRKSVEPRGAAGTARAVVTATAASTRQPPKTVKPSSTAYLPDSFVTTIVCEPGFRPDVLNTTALAWRWPSAGTVLITC